MLRYVVSIFALTFGFILSMVNAQEPPVLSFKSWKDQQVIEARNHVVRLTNQVTLSKAGKSAVDAGARAEDAAAAGAEALELTRVQKTPGASRAAADLKRAMDNLQAARELTMEDYFVVYLTRFKNQPEALDALAQRLSKEEIAELLKVMVSRNRQSEAASPKSALGGLVAGDHAAR